MTGVQTCALPIFTSAEDLDVVRMVLSGTTNKRLAAQLLSAGVRAVGVSGEDAGMFRARITDDRMGKVGGRVDVDGTLVAHLVAGGFVPVVSPLSLISMRAPRPR